MTKSVFQLYIECIIERLELPDSHLRAYPVSERRIKYFDACRELDDLYDYSDIDEYLYGQLHDRLVHAYVNGGLQ